MSNSIGNSVRLTIFGQSHSTAIGAVIEGLPPGRRIDWDGVQSWMDRRAPGNSPLSTARKESDAPIILSGQNAGGETCAAPLAVMIENRDARSGDYDDMISTRTARPGHADYSAWMKYGRAHDARGGGMFSGRMTAPLTLVGAIAAQFIKEDYGVITGVRIAECGGISDSPRKPDRVDASILAALRGKSFPVLDDARGERMRQAIAAAAADRDSVGGILECRAIGVPPGLGEPMFGGMENEIARVIFGIPAVRGIAFGAGEGSGFAAAGLRGSQHNDAFIMNADGEAATATNRHGGILGGISTGMPIVFEVCVKPTPTIGIGQDAIRLDELAPVKIEGKGRHDPCIVPRAAVVAEAALAFALLDALEARRGKSS